MFQKKFSGNNMYEGGIAWKCIFICHVSHNRQAGADATA